MLIAIMSDSHDQWDHLQKAVDLANERGCEALLFAGDLIAPPGIAILESFKGQVHFVWGNNEAERVGMTRKFDASSTVKLAGDIYEGKLSGLKVFMNHYPRITELAAKSGEFDLCVFGHTHEYSVQTVGQTLLINPGEIQGYLTGTAGFIIVDAATKQAERITL